MVIPWKQTRLPFTVQFQLNYWVNCRVLLGNVAERTWYKFVDCMEKGIMSYKLYGKNLVIPWKQTRLPFTVQFQLNYWVNCRVLLGNVTERTWYKFVDCMDNGMYLL